MKRKSKRKRELARRKTERKMEAIKAIKGTRGLTGRSSSSMKIRTRSLKGS